MTLENLFTTPIMRVLKRSRKKLTPVLRKIHHAADPTKTPSTISDDVVIVTSVSTVVERVVKIAMNARMVMGLVRAKKSVEVYAVTNPRALAVAASSAGGVNHVLIPR